MKTASLWVEGPAGSGKTTLVNSYLEANAIPCVWYRFDERDGELGNFFYYLGKAAETVARENDQPLPALTPEYLLDVPTFARNFFEQFYHRLQSARSQSPSGSYTVVFDDYHLIAPDSLLHNIMKIALSEATPGVRIIFLSRLPLPQELSTLHANRALTTIAWEDLRLTLDETTGIARLIRGNRDQKALVEQLHEGAQQWVAGLIMFLEQLKRTGDKGGMHQQLPTSILNYFADTVFDTLDEGVKDFLLKSAFLPFMTTEMAAHISGCDNVEQVLEDLHRKNFFTEKRQSGTITYLYHALFREFLIARSEQTLTAEDLVQIRRQAGAVLMAAGYKEQAADLFQESGDWASLTQLVAENAQELLQQGRSRLLESWLAAMPEDRLKTDPWLQYWLGMCRLYFAPPQARANFEAAYRQFAQAGDRTGQCLAWAGIIDTGMITWGEGASFPQWIATMERLLAQDDSFPSPEIAARVTMGMFTALLFNQPWHDKITVWAERLLQCIQA
ncbi:MAG: hypothetical protein P8173_16355, partial [Gammaproteobacteria bacterium]